MQTYQKKKRGRGKPNRKKSTKKGMRKSLVSAVRAIAKEQIEKEAEKKDFGFDSPAQVMISDVTGTTNNVFALVPPTFLGVAAFQRIGSQIKVHKLKIKVQGWADFDQSIIKKYPNGMLVDLRIFSVKGQKNCNAYQLGQSSVEINAALQSYLYNGYYLQSSTPTAGQYKPITGAYSDDFFNVNTDVITEHYKSSVLLNAAYNEADSDPQLYAERDQYCRGFFEKEVDILPFVNKTFKYDPQPDAVDIGQAALYPTNVLLFATVSLRNPTTANGDSSNVAGYWRVAVTGVFSD